MFPSPFRSPARATSVPLLPAELILIALGAEKARAGVV